MISLVVPTAGLFRHNERLWPEILAASLKTKLELVLVCQEPPSPRLFSRLASLRLAFVPVVVESSATVGEMVEAGFQASTGDYLSFMHDDVMPIESMLAEVLSSLLRPGLTVPHVAGSNNSDQDPEQSPDEGITTRFIDRAMFSLCRASWEEIQGHLKLALFEIDGYQIAIQSAMARLGYPAWVAPVCVAHEGSATLSDVRPGMARKLFSRDVARVAEALGTHVENNSRPALPRIIPKGFCAPSGGVFHTSASEVDELVNLVDCDLWKINGRPEVEKRIRLGHKFAVASTIDVLDIAFPSGTGLGDALMHTSGIGEFKRRNPHVLIRTFSPEANAQVFERCPAVDESVPISGPHDLPASCVTWNNSNAWEGTADWGFNHLRIEDTPLEARRMFFEPKPIADVFPTLQSPTIGLQIAGGWRHKRYVHVFDLARSLLALGFDIRLFSPASDTPVPGDLFEFLADASTLDSLAAWQRALSLWIGFDSGPSFLANALGVPSLWLYASHNPAGMIGRCGAAAPWSAIWPAKSGECARKYRLSCRPHGNAIFETMELCPLLNGKNGAKCLDEIEPAEIIREADKLLAYAGNVT